MKSLIIYGSQIKLTTAHRPVSNEGHQPSYFVRVEQFNGFEDQALEKARPMKGETVLNTVPILECES